MVAAVIENRAKEVGLALFDKQGGPSLGLEQHIESGTSYSTLLCELHAAKPGVILTLAETDAGGAMGLGDELRRFAASPAHDCALVELPRRQFDDTAGAEMVSKCARHGSRLAANPRDMYLAFGAAAAVLQFVSDGGSDKPRENHGRTAHVRRSSRGSDAFAWGVGQAGGGRGGVSLDSTFVASPGTVNVTCSRSKHFLTLDADVARNLEIAAPLGPSGERLHEPSRGGRGGKKGGRGTGRLSLFGLLNTCATKGGSRLLKASLLQPLKDHATIGARLDALDELLRAGDAASQLRKHLQSMPQKDIDKIIAQFALPRGQRKNTASAATTASTTASSTALRERPPDASHVAGQIKTLLEMRATFAAVPLMGSLLDATHVRSPLLVEIGKVLRDGFFGGFLERVGEVLEDDVVEGRSTFAQQTRQVFAVKGGVNSFLDIARRSFCETTEAMHELVRMMREQTQLDTLKLDYSNTTGFRLSMSVQEYRALQAAPNAKQHFNTLQCLDSAAWEFAAGRAGAAAGDALKPSGKRKTWPTVACTCRELDTLNARFKEAMSESFALSAGVIEGLVTHIRENSPRLGMLSSAISLLDMLLAFANHIMSSRGVGFSHFAHLLHHHSFPGYGSSSQTLSIRRGLYVCATSVA